MKGQRLVRRFRAARSAPEIVVVALFEHGEHGQFAAPIVRDVLKAYFDKKTSCRAEQQQQLAADWRPSAADPPGMPGPGCAGARDRFRASPRQLVRRPWPNLTWPATSPSAISTGRCW